MKLYYAANWNMHNVAAATVLGIGPSEGMETVPLADSPEIAKELIRFLISPEHRESTPIQLFTITVPDEMELKRYGDDEKYIMSHFYAYPGPIPPEAVYYEIEVDELAGQWRETQHNDAGRQTMKTYQERKEEIRQAAIDWQIDTSERECSLDEIVEKSAYFEKMGRRFGLLSEFRENGIC